MKQIHITRDSSGTVKFETVFIDNTETVFFTNMDPKQPHKPSILKLVGTEHLGPYPSPNSSQCPVPPPTIGQAPPYQVQYTCEVPEPEHENETGTINVCAPLDAAPQTELTATKGQSTNQPVVVGGMPPYTITDLVVNNTNVPGTSTQPAQTLPIGTDLKLVQNDQGISIVGTPTQAETYYFTFTVNDSMGRNLQQVQYSMTVS